MWGARGPGPGGPALNPPLNVLHNFEQTSNNNVVATIFHATCYVKMVPCNITFSTSRVDDHLEMAHIPIF